MSKRIAIFASGGGSNAEKIIQYFEDRDDVEIALILTNRSKAGVLEHAKHYHIPARVINKEFLSDEEKMMTYLVSHEIDLIVLAGFLLLIPDYLVQKFRSRILNIHPSLLPKYGGEGMYGKHVHNAVYAAGEEKSGMTIHLVNEKYDDGRILFQEEVDVSACNGPDDVAAAVLRLEHKYYPRVIDNYLQRLD